MTAPQPPLRLLYVVNNADFFVSHRLPLGLAALAAGYEVHVACPPSATLDALPAHGFRIHELSLARGRNTLRSESDTLRSLFRLYRKLRPDIVHHVTVKPVLYGSVAARMAGVPAVVNAMSGLGYLYTTTGLSALLRRVAVETVYRFAFRRPRLRVIFQNPDDREIFVRRRLVRERDSALVRGSGVDPTEFAPSPEPDAEHPVIVLPARLLWDKGVGEFIDAARLLKERRVAADMVLVGDVDDGNPSSVPRPRIQEWVADGTVRWWGFRADMPEVYAASSIVCLPSYREGVPKSLLEAAACARAIVASDVPGCREVVADGVNGLLVPPRDAVALADALQTLIEDAALRRTMGLAGRRRVESEFTLELLVGQQLALYRQLAAGL